MINKPIATHSSAGTNAGFDNGGKKRVISSNPSGTKMPQHGALMVARAADDDGGKEHDRFRVPPCAGDHRLIKPTSTAPERPAIIPPSTIIEVR